MKFTKLDEMFNIKTDKDLRRVELISMKFHDLGAQAFKQNHTTQNVHDAYLSARSELSGLSTDEAIIAGKQFYAGWEYKQKCETALQALADEGQARGDYDVNDIRDKRNEFGGETDTQNNPGTKQQIMRDGFRKLYGEQNNTTLHVSEWELTLKTWEIAFALGYETAQRDAKGAK